MTETIDLNTVATFVRVVENDGFTAAAEVLGVPKSTVSRSVKRLEEELGVRLLQRTTRRVRLTEAGRAYYERVSSALAGMHEARAAIGDMQEKPRGLVRITAPPDVGAELLAPILSRFSRRYPDIHVEISVTNRIVDLVKEGFDLAVRMAKLADSTLIARPIGAVDFGLFASPAYLAKRPAPKKLADLASHAFVGFKPLLSRSRLTLEGPRGPESVEVSGPLFTDDMACARASVLHGAGVGLLPAIQTDGLIHVLSEYAAHGAQGYVVYPSARYVPMRVALVRDAILEGVTSACGLGVARQAKVG